MDEIARRPFSIPISCYLKLNFDGLLARIWAMMVGWIGWKWVKWKGRKWAAFRACRCIWAMMVGGGAGGKAWVQVG